MDKPVEVIRGALGSETLSSAEAGSDASTDASTGAGLLAHEEQRRPALAFPAELQRGRRARGRAQTTATVTN